LDIDDLSEFGDEWDDDDEPQCGEGPQPQEHEEPCFLASEFPPVPAWAREPPKPRERRLFDLDAG
jgi:hypothetical protein